MNFSIASLIFCCSIKLLHSLEFLYAGEDIIKKWRISPKNIYFKKINQTIREMNQSGEKLNHNAKKKK